MFYIYKVNWVNCILICFDQEISPIRKLEIDDNLPSGQQLKIDQLSRVTVVIEDASQNYGLVKFWS